MPHTTPVLNVMQVAPWLRAQGVSQLWADSRQLQAGDGFVAWPGTGVDARQYVDGALRSGARACVVDAQGIDAFAFPADTVVAVADLKRHSGTIAADFFANPSEQLQVVAVTGTNGKTSTAWWLAQALSALPPALALPCGVVGTLGVGRPPAVGAGQESAQMQVTGFTTPDPVRLQQTLRQFVDSGLRACAMEASSIGIEEHRLTGVAVQVAVFTNFTQDHLDYHGSMEAYWQAKCKLFSWAGLRSAVVNVDDVHGAELLALCADKGLDVWAVSRQKLARLQACNVRYTPQGVAFEVLEHSAQGAVVGSAVLQTRMIGDYNISNLLGVLGAMRSMQIPLAAAVPACAQLHPVPGRMECFGGVAAPLVAVDYAHTPDALEHALAALRPMAQARQGKLWCVFGCGGDRDASKRPLMGAVAVQQADHVLVTSDNPRSEKAQSIIAQVLLGVTHDVNVDVQSDRAQAIAQAIAQAHANDVILVAGKGHETTQEIAGEKFPFSDREHVVAALRAHHAVNQELAP